LSSWPPNRTRKTPKERGGHEDLTKGFGTARGAAEKEIGGEGRSSGSASSGGGTARTGKGGGAVREVQGRVPPFYSPERRRGRGVEAVGGEVSGRPPLMAMGSLGGGSFGAGRGGGGTSGRWRIEGPARWGGEGVREAGEAPGRAARRGHGEDGAAAGG
jgi:hypothetical protein